MQNFGKRVFIISLLSLLIPALILGGYVLSVIWRASVAEVELFGSSKLIPIKVQEIYFPGPRNETTFYNNTYWFNRNGEKILVWTDKINCFQHVYGSSLAAFELGEIPAHLLFCANEFAEYTFDWNGVTLVDVLDRRKDLAHNAVGRKLAKIVHDEKLSGKMADTRIKELILKEMDIGERVYLSYLDERVAELPMESELGCPGLPQRNIFNAIADSIDECKVINRQLKSKIAEVKKLRI